MTRQSGERDAKGLFSIDRVAVEAWGKSRREAVAVLVYVFPI